MAPRAGNAADGTQRERAYSSDLNRRHWSMDAEAREAAGNADQPRRAPTHLGHRCGHKTLADQVPEHLPVDRLRWIRRRTLAEEHHWRAPRYGGRWTPVATGRRDA
ncbi:hypothetical protein STBA_37620 [Streptomyces sp. MP131-18]|nr:hypothetical protein STBA_37620 [Streptomyces sp. MP131-18]